MTSEFEEIQRKLRPHSRAVAKWKSRVAKPNDADMPEEMPELLKRGKAIYGRDNRVDSTDQTDVPRAVIQSVCLLFDKNELEKKDDKIHLRTQVFGEVKRLCPKQLFWDQPVMGFGTGFLVEDNVLATAGHNIDEYEDRLADVRVLFDFEIGDDGATPRLIRDESDFYHIASAPYVELGPYGLDYAIVKLDRKVTAAEPLTLLDKDVEVGDEVYVVGHPAGLPKKVAKGATVKNNSKRNYFVANLDTFAGNSGSPVLTKNNKVCGILVRGMDDFNLIEKDDCYFVARFPTNMAGEDVCRTSVWSPFVSKLIGLAEAKSGKTDAPVEHASANAGTDPQPESDEYNFETFAKELERFLRRAYSDPNELERLAFFKSHLKKLQADVNWNGSFNKVVHQFIQFSMNHNLFGDVYFQIFKKDRDQRIKEIERLEHIFANIKRE